MKKTRKHNPIKDEENDTPIIRSILYISKIPSYIKSKKEFYEMISQINDNTTLTNNLKLNDNLTKVIDSPITKPKKGYFIQLASFNNKNKAELSVDILNEKLAVTLAGNSLKIMKVDLGQGKGVWWRIVTDILSRSESETICALLKSEGNNCIVRSK